MQTQFTPLHTAVFNGHQDAAKLLLEAGADPSLRNKRGKTPRDLAKRAGSEALIWDAKIQGGVRESNTRLEQ